MRCSLLFETEPKDVLSSGKGPVVVKARSLLCYWMVRKCGVSATDLARRIGISQPAVSISVKRGEKIASEKNFLTSNHAPFFQLAMREASTGEGKDLMERKGH